MRGGRDILSEYGSDVHKPQASRATSGGVEKARDVMNYKEPQGPLNRHHQGPGLHDDNHGMAHKPSGGSTSGCPGIGGTVHRSGSQR